MVSQRTYKIGVVEALIKAGKKDEELERWTSSVMSIIAHGPISDFQKCFSLTFIIRALIFHFFHNSKVEVEIPGSTASLYILKRTYFLKIKTIIF